MDEQTALMEAAVRASWKSHNDYRKKHDAPALLLNKKLTEEAEQEAKALLTGAPSSNVKERKSELGRNEFQARGTEGIPIKTIARDAVDEWYGHIEQYNWDSPLSSPDSAGMASQILWTKTTAIGIGIACNEDSCVIVALYEPAGNLASNQIHNENVHKALW